MFVSAPSIGKSSRRLTDRGILLVLLLVGLVNGLIYLFLMPPWQHYDEPNHFEVVWLDANLNRLPRPGDYDPEMSYAVVTSMAQNRFYGDTTSGMPAPGEQVQIPGYSQLDEPPFYYLLTSLPLRLLRLTGVEGITNQLYAARLVSLLLYLFTLICAWGITAELAAPGHPLRWMVPFSLAMLPGFADLMTAVNNDVGAIALVSFFLWGAVRLIQRPFSLLNLALVVLAAGLSYFVKVTALYSLILLPIAVLFSLLRGRLRWVAWLALAGAVLALLVAAITWGDASWWARDTLQETNTRLETGQSPLGKYAFQIELPAGTAEWEDYQLHQLIALPEDEGLRDGEVTIGAWMWASQSIQASSPIFNSVSGFQRANQVVDLTTQPQFFAFSVPVEGDAGRNFISLAPLFQALNNPAVVYYDGLVLLPGRWPLDQVPAFDNPDGTSGSWGGQSFKNLIRNPSAEQDWIRLRPWVDTFGMCILPDKGANQPSVMLYYLLDIAGAGPFQRISSQVLFRTFWARFGWGHVPLIYGWVYWLILGAMIIGLFGALVAIWRRRRTFPWSVALFMGLALFGLWLQTFLRGANYPTQLRPIYYPTARYAFPVVIPTMMFLNLGWYEIGLFVKNLLQIPSRWLSIGYILAWIALDYYAILSIAQFYYQIF